MLDIVELLLDPEVDVTLEVRSTVAQELMFLRRMLDTRTASDLEHLRKLKAARVDLEKAEGELRVLKAQGGK